MDDTAMSTLITELPATLEQYFPLDTAQHKGQLASSRLIENMLLQQFTSHLRSPTTSTKGFFRDLSDKISSFFTDKDPNEDARLRKMLRSLVIRFIETCLSKVMWYPTDVMQAWSSFIAMGNGIHLFGAHHVITHMDAIDELEWTLVHRFALFIDQFAPEFSLSAIATMKSALEHKTMPFLATDELDEGITRKDEVLLASLAKAQAVVLAQSAA